MDVCARPNGHAERRESNPLSHPAGQTGVMTAGTVPVRGQSEREIILRVEGDAAFPLSGINRACVFTNET